MPTLLESRHSYVPSRELMITKIRLKSILPNQNPSPLRIRIATRVPGRKDINQPSQLAIDNTNKTDSTPPRSQIYKTDRKPNHDQEPPTVSATALALGMSATLSEKQPQI